MKFRLSYLILLGLLVCCIAIVVSSHNVSARAATWDGGGADNLASTKENWDGPDIAPVAGDNVIFNSGSKACTFNIAVTFAGVYLNSSYTGTVTWQAIVNCTGFTMASGTLLSADYNLYYIITTGNFVKTGGTINAGTMHIEFLTDGSTYTANNAVNWGKFVVRGNLGLQSSILILSGGGVLQVNSGKTLTIADTKSVSDYGNAGVLNGVIAGTGIYYSFRANGNLPSYANCRFDCPVQILKDNAGSKVPALTSNVYCTSTLQVLDSYGSDTVTLDLKGYSVKCLSLTCGARGIVSSSVSGSKLDIGTSGLTVSANGQLDLTNIGIVYCKGNFNPSAGTFKCGTSRFYMGASGTTTLAFGQYLYDVYVNSSVTRTLASLMTVQHHKEVNGVLLQAGYNLVINGSYGIPISINGTVNGNVYVNTSYTTPLVYCQVPNGGTFIRGGNLVFVMTGDYRLRCIRDTGSSSITLNLYQWDALGYRWQASSSGSTTNYTYSAQMLFANDYYNLFRDNVLVDTQYCEDGWIYMYENGTWSSHTYTIAAYAGDILPSSMDYNPMWIWLVFLFALTIITYVGYRRIPLLAIMGMLASMLVAIASYTAFGDLWMIPTVIVLINVVIAVLALAKR